MDIEYNFSVFTITQLKSLCYYLNICDLGTKDVLILRLKSVDFDKVDQYIDFIDLNNQMSALSI
jgi:hypothetical protein